MADSQAFQQPQQKIWVGYCRVSTEAQAELGASIEIQKQYIQKYCESRDIKVERFFVDEGYTGGNFERPGFQELVQDVKARKIAGMVVHKIDRFSRDLYASLGMLKFFENNSVSFLSVSDNIDTSTPMGKFGLQMMFGFAEAERGQIKNRVILGLKHRRSIGVITQVCPFGYKAEKKMVNGKMKVDTWRIYPPQEVIVKDVFAKIQNGKTYTQIAKEVGKSINFVKQLLHNRVYTGKLSRPGTKTTTEVTRLNPETNEYESVWMQDARGEYKKKVVTTQTKEWFDGTHEAIIDEVQFEKVQSILKAYEKRNKGAV